MSPIGEGMTVFVITAKLGYESIGVLETVHGG